MNQTEGAAQVPAETAGRQTYRAVYANDTWHFTPKLTINAGLRYELQGPWDDRYNRLSYWNPSLTNGTVTGCSGVPGSPCIGDAALVGTGINPGRNNLPLDKNEFSPRLGFAYSWDQKTVIRGGYGVFWIPNYVSFGLNPDNDLINLATTPFVATTNHGLSPAATLDNSNCTAGRPNLWQLYLRYRRTVRGERNSSAAGTGTRTSPTLLPLTDRRTCRHITSRRKAMCNSTTWISSVS